MAIKIVECYSVSPAEGAAPQQSLPLLYFDIVWLLSRPTESLHFYALKCSESCFLETIAVKLKRSLSITLKHFLPFASKIIFPLTSTAMPVSRYTAGDSVALTIATSDADFADMTVNHSKVADESRQLVPQMPPAVYSSDDIKISAIAIQVTLFPNQGICIGFAHHHAICDAVPVFGFVRSWAATHKSNGDDERLDQNFLPFYGRNSVQDAHRLGIFVWNQIKSTRPAAPLPVSLPLHILRATFIISDNEIEKLKSFAVVKNPFVGRVSTFVVVCAHLWSCLAKSAAAAGEEVDDDEPEYLCAAVDCRSRLTPPLPDNYFGNCLKLLLAVSSHGRLKGNDGFVAAVEAIAAAIRKTIVNGRGASDYYENRSQIHSELIGKRWFSIAGSSRLDPYGVDFGWGRAVKYELVNIDLFGGVNLCKARDGGVEIGLSMTKATMDFFADVFKKYLYINSNL